MLVCHPPKKSSYKIQGGEVLKTMNTAVTVLFFLLFVMNDDVMMTPLSLCFLFWPTYQPITTRPTYSVIGVIGTTTHEYGYIDCKPLCANMCTDALV